MKQKMLITGIKGFIGHHCYKLFKDDYDVIGIDNCSGLAHEERNAPFINANLIDCELPKVDIVLHLAARAGVKPSFEDVNGYYKNNVLVTKRLFDHYTNSLIVYASSSSVVENTSPYSMTKSMCELMAPENAIGVRFFTVYGPYGRPDMLVRRLKSGEVFETISNHSRDYTHVYDVAKGIKAIIELDPYKHKNGVYDIGEGRSIKNTYLCNLFNQYPKEVEVLNESQSTCADPTFMQSIGWKADYPIEIGINHL